MHFEPDDIYHVYNRGDKKNRIFFIEDNYHFFLNKIKKEWLDLADILTYCLMPNHFHFMLQPKPDGCRHLVQKEHISHLQVLSKNNWENA